jgi:hypothetical protein
VIHRKLGGGCTTPGSLRDGAMKLTFQTQEIGLEFACGPKFCVCCELAGLGKRGVAGAAAHVYIRNAIMNPSAGSTTLYCHRIALEMRKSVATHPGWDNSDHVFRGNV